MSPPRSAVLPGSKPSNTYYAAEAAKVTPVNTTGAPEALSRIKYTRQINVVTGVITSPLTFTAKVMVTPHPKYKSVTDIAVKFFTKGMFDRVYPVGNLQAQTVNRQIKGVSKPLYLAELLESNLERPMSHACEGEDSDADEIQTIMRHLFREDGSPREEYRGRPLGGTSLNLIAEFEIDTKARGSGLAQLAMTAYLEAIQQLAGEHAHKGTVVLSPAALRSHYGAQAGSRPPTKSYVEVEHGLIASYRKSQYKVWTKADDALEGSGITIMGRTIGEVHPEDMDLQDEPTFPPAVRVAKHIAPLYTKTADHAPANDVQGVKPIEQQTSDEIRVAQRSFSRSKETSVKEQKSSRKRKAAVENVLDDVDSRPTKRQYSSPQRDANDRETKKREEGFTCTSCHNIVRKWSDHDYECRHWGSRVA